MAACSRAWGCCHSLAGILSSNSAGGVDVCILKVLRALRWRFLRRADHSSRGVLPNVVRPMSVNAKVRNRIGSNRHIHKKRK